MADARGRVLIDVDESCGALWGVRGLRRGGYEPWIAVPRRDTYAARSRAAAGHVDVPRPAAQPDEFVRALVEAAHRLEVAAVLPGTESSLRALSRRRDDFGGIPLGAPDVALVDAATDKGALADRAAAAGLRTPATVCAEAGDPRVRDVPFPALLKPLRSVSTAADGSLRSERVELISDAAHLERVLAERSGDVLVQQHVDGLLAAVSGVAWNGEVVCTVHQVSRRIWPVERGITAYGETVERDAELDAGVRSFVSSIGWSGVFQAQFIRSGDGAFLVDFNPRIYGSVGLAIVAGLNLPAIWLNLLLGREPRVGTYRAGTRYRVEEDDVRALLAGLRAGRRVETLRALVPRRRTAHAVFHFRDPAPVFATLSKAARGLRRERANALTSARA